MIVRRTAASHWSDSVHAAIVPTMPSVLGDPLRWPGIAAKASSNGAWSTCSHRGSQPGEIERLAGGAEGDQPPLEPFVGDRERAVHRSGVNEFTPDLVGDHEQVAALGDVGNGGHLVDVEHPAGGIVGVAEQDHPRSVIDRGRQPLGVDPPTVLSSSATSTRRRSLSAIASRNG